MSVDRVDNIKDAPERTLSRVIGHASDGKGGAATLESLKEQLAITSGDVSGAVPDTREVATENGIQGGGPLDGDLTLSLTDTTVAAGTYGGASAVPVITVDVKGRVTAAEEVEVEVPASGVVADTYGSATEIPVVTVGADGRITDVSTAPAAGVRTHIIMANQMQASLGTATAGTISPAGSGQKFASLEFDASTAENARFFLPMPAAWDLDPVDVRIGWAPADGNSGNVLWNLRASTIMADDSSNTLARDWGSSVNVISAAPGAANEMQVASFANVTPSGTPAAGAFLSFLLTRFAADGGDTYAADARLMWVQILYGVTSNSDA
jgi:hypothetical protein